MMTEEYGRITVYNPKMAVEVAEMFNAFNEIFLGGFGGGILYDEQRVRDWLDRSSAVADLIALDPEGSPVGYLGMYPHFRDRDAAYLTLLGVLPRAQGKKLGKRLMLKALEIAAERGIKRVDLYTWSGNMDPLPLYKKVGFFWVPDTSIYMQNFVPEILQMSLAEEWFSRHPDWYTCFDRKISLTPDKTVIEGIDVYAYTFQSGDDTLSASIDRYGWGVCGIERVLDGERLSVKTFLCSHDIFVGIPNALTISITNETGRTFSAALQVEPFTGLQWENSFPPSITVKNGESVEITRTFVVDSSVTLFTFYDMPSESITSVITLEDYWFALRAGGRILPAVAVHSEDMYTMAPVEKETRVYLDLINNTERELSGIIDICIGGTKNHELDFVLSPREMSYIAIPVIISAGVTSCSVEVTPVLDSGGHSMPSYRHTVVADVKDVAAVAERPDERLCVITDFVRIDVERENGRIAVSPQRQEMKKATIDFEVGSDKKIHQSGSRNA
jgi:ribosomal protein S18 acetylase RimI-like enzyme